MAHIYKQHNTSVQKAYMVIFLSAARILQSDV